MPETKFLFPDAVPAATLLLPYFEVGLSIIIGFFRLLFGPADSGTF